MPEFTRDELSKLHNLLGELVDAVGADSSFTPSTAPSREDMVKEAAALQSKIATLLYPP